MGQRWGIYGAAMGIYGAVMEDLWGSDGGSMGQRWGICGAATGIYGAAMGIYGAAPYLYGLREGVPGRKVPPLLSCASTAPGSCEQPSDPQPCPIAPPHSTAP